MDSNQFTEKDKEEVIRFLNLVATHATFTLDTKQIIEYFKALSVMQQVIIPKIHANIFEVLKVVDKSEDKSVEKIEEKPTKARK